MLWGHRTRAVATSAALLLYHDLCSARSTVQRRLQQGQPPRAQVTLSRWRMPVVAAVTPDLSLASTVNVTPGMSSCFSCSLPLRPPDQHSPYRDFAGILASCIGGLGTLRQHLYSRVGAKSSDRTLLNLPVFRAYLVPCRAN